MLQLYLCRLSELPQSAALAQRLLFADPHDMLTGQGMRSERARERLSGAWLLQQALSRAGIDSQGLVWSVGEAGRPFLPDSGVDFNLSHSGDLLACALLTNASQGDLRVGVDIEEFSRRTLDQMQRLALRWFSSSERELWLSDPTEQTFLSIWTAKEALVKHSGIGISGISSADSLNPPSGLEISRLSLPSAQLSLCHPSGLSLENIIWI